MTPSLCIIIVNYNTADLLTRCLNSIKAQLGQPCRIIVVDNASVDDSVQRIRVEYPDVELIANKKNLGFAAANNQAMQRTADDLLFFLNPDTELQPGCLKVIREFMVSHPEVGLAGPAIINADRSPHNSAEYSYPGARYQPGLFEKLPGDIAWILGAAMVARREVITEIQGFDERFFLYAEDIDLCLKIRQKGWSLALIPNAKVMHLEGQSEKQAPFVEVMKRKIRSELIFLNKYYKIDIVRKIRWTRLVEAWWRICCLRIRAVFFGLTDKNRLKLIRYGVVAEEYGQSGKVEER
jgi:GT2 family glycosyltransferase